MLCRGATYAAVAAAPEAAGVRVWEIISRGWGPRGRRPLPEGANVAYARQLLERTEDVGERFAEEARRIHSGESEARGMRGQASTEERAALREEGNEVLSFPLPAVLKGPLQ